MRFLLFFFFVVGQSFSKTLIVFMLGGGWAAIVLQRLSATLLNTKSWVQLPLGE